MKLEMKYFVLKPRAKGCHDMLARASQEAMRTYAREISLIDMEFASALLGWADEEAYLQDRMQYD